MYKKVVVIFFGCGVYDGVEIYESVIILFCFSQCGVEV